MSKIEVDCSEIIDGLCGLLSRFAVKTDKIGNLNRHNIAVHRGIGKMAGRVRFEFMTRENMGVAFSVDMSDLIRDPRRYLDGVMADVVTAVNQARARRQQESQIIIDSAVAQPDPLRDAVRSVMVH